MTGPVYLTAMSDRMSGKILRTLANTVFHPSVHLSVNFYIFDFFSRTTGPISTRLGTDHPLGEGFQVCSNEGDRSSSRGDNSKRVKTHWKFLKFFFSRTSRPNSIKLGTNYPWVKGIQISSNKGPGPLQRGDNHKNEKNGMGSSKNFLLQNHWANFNQHCHRSSLGKGNSSLFKWRG
jgi:hypothetical protein